MAGAILAVPVSHENVEIVRRVYDAGGQGDVLGPPEVLLHPDIEYVNPAGAVEPGTRRGLAAFVGAVTRVAESWDYWRIEPEELLPLGDRVVAIVGYRARGRGSQLEVTGRES